MITFQPQRNGHHAVIAGNVSNGIKIGFMHVAGDLTNRLYYKRYDAKQNMTVSDFADFETLTAMVLWINATMLNIPDDKFTFIT